jgi:hypothetical protein
VRFARSTAAFVLHSAAAIAGSVTVAILLAPLFGPAILESVPLLISPLAWGPGFALGLVINRLSSHRSACWTWSVGLVWLAYGIWDACRIYRFPPWFPPKGDFVHRAWHIFFTFNDAEAWGGSSLATVIFTIPALSSIAYSVGSWLALRTNRKADPDTA